MGVKFLYACEQFVPASRFGDVFSGMTDSAAKAEFCRNDQPREECRTCPFLPDCTAFRNCPVREYHCREMHELLLKDTLCRMIDQKDDVSDADTPRC
ncbi:MAG: hypothetical protein IJK01_05630 [Clostridia bacterium]|nr:hypothetical protein [Clostridia bacterium]